MRARVCLLLLSVLCAQASLAQQAKGNEADKSAIAKNAEAFIAAFQKGDAKGLAALWTDDGTYTTSTGRQLKGRAAMEKAFSNFFGEHKGLKLRIESDSLRFVTKDVAIEDGVTVVLPADGAPPSRARYTIVHVRKNGKWYLDSVRDSTFTAPTNYEHLRGLEWAIGDWVGEDGKGGAETLSVSWGENQNFIHATFTTTVKGIAVGSAHHWIGWDPIKKTARCWIFDATGGFGEGTLMQAGKKLSIKTSSVLREGKKATATYVITVIDDNTISLQSKDQTVGGEKIPDSKALKLKRIQ